MSCNGCRVLRKGCNESCILRSCLQWIETPEAQGHATVFVAKFFGRAGLMSFISAVPEIQRPALFQSLLFEACGRTVNPVNGAVGLLSTGNWHVCQAAVEMVLRGGILRPMPEFLAGIMTPESDEVSDVERSRNSYFERKAYKRKGNFVDVPKFQPGDLDLGLNPGFPSGRIVTTTSNLPEKRRPETPEESVTTTFDSVSAYKTKGGEVLRITGTGFLW